MAKKVIGFNSEDDFERMSRSVRKSESVPQVGQRQRAKYPQGGGGIKVERAIITEVGASGVHKAFLVTGTFDDDLDTPDITSTQGQTEIYTGEHVETKLQAGDNVMIAQVSGKWWIVEAPQDCRGTCVDILDPVGSPGWIATYRIYMPALTCCPEASGTHLLIAASSSADWESQTFQCNSDGTDRKWVFNGTSLTLDPPLSTGSVAYRHEPDNKTCPTKMFAYNKGLFVKECGDFPDTICMIPQCARGNNPTCPNGSKRLWKIVWTDSGLTDKNADHSGQCSNLTPGMLLKWTFTYQNVVSDVYADEYFPTPEEIDTWSYGVSADVFVRLGDTSAGGCLPPSIVRIVDKDYYIEGHDPDVDGDICAAVPGNCTGMMKFIRYDDPLSNPAAEKCENYPDIIYAIPVGEEFIESPCFPDANLPLFDSNGSIAEPYSDSDVVCNDLPYILKADPGYTSNVTNNGCSDCDEFNDEFELKLYSAGVHSTTLRAYWQSDEFTPTCGGNPARWVLILTDTASTCILRISENAYGESGGTDYATYKLWNNASDGNVDTWNCYGENTFARTSSSSDCYWPSTMKIRVGGQ